MDLQIKENQMTASCLPHTNNPCKTLSASTATESPKGTHKFAFPQNTTPKNFIKLSKILAVNIYNNVKLYARPLCFNGI